MIKTCLVLLLINNSLQCSTTPSFTNNIVELNGENETISDCISPDTLRFKGNILSITATKQKIPALNYGSVQGISSTFHASFLNNSIESIKSRAFLNLPNLEKIVFTGNELAWIDEEAFADLPSLSGAYLNDNKIIAVFQGAFSNLPKLVEVDLRGNALENFDQSWFQKTPFLQQLTLARNRLRRILPGAFTKLPKIRMLRLDENEIEFIDRDAFRGLKELALLDLQSNRLHSFEFNFFTPSPLSFLDISNNNITYISDKTLDTIRPKLVVFRIERNPWQCPCLDLIIKGSALFERSTFLSLHVLVLPESKQGAAVCVFAKTNSDQCLKRSDDDFQEGYWSGFVREK